MGGTLSPGSSVAVLGCRYQPRTPHVTPPSRRRWICLAGMIVNKPHVTLRGFDLNYVILEGEYKRANGIKVLRTDDVFIENMPARSHTIHGYFWTSELRYRSSYLNGLQQRRVWDTALPWDHPDTRSFWGQPTLHCATKRRTCPSNAENLGPTLSPLPITPRLFCAFS